jgi:peptidoglycan/LPS O-acetylase OafA/YrhL
LQLRNLVQRFFVPPLVIIISLAIAGLWYGKADRVSRALSWRPLAYLGTISYGMYLYHMACLVGVRAFAAWSLQHGIKIKFYFLVPLFILVVISVASLSYRFVERPFLRLKDRFRAPTQAPKSVG